VMRKMCMLNGASLRNAARAQRKDVDHRSVADLILTI
jgi:hypothetical protein